MYALRSTLAWIFVVGSATSSDFNVFDYDSASLTFGLSLEDTCHAVRECSNCKTSKLCIPSNEGFKQVASISCDSNPDTPYCDWNTGLCTNIAPNGCESKDFICPSENGIYPDPNSCTRYHICVNGFRTTNVCPINNVYDHSLGECKLRRRVSDCVVVNCKGQDGNNFIYSKDDRIYGTCVNGKPFLLGRCKDYERYDLSLGSCVRVCRGPSTQPSDQCQQYIRCAEISSNKYVPVVQYCACDKGYDVEEGVCTKDAPCLNNKTTCQPRSYALSVASHNLSDEDESEENSSYDSSDDEEQDASDSADDEEVSPFIINNSDNSYGKNEVSNGDDSNNGNIVNGNGNSNNANEGNVGNVVPGRPGLRPLIVINSGDRGSSNGVSNGDDSNNGNIVNGNDNSNNANEGNVGNVVPGRPGLRPLIVINSGDRGSSNDVSNGNDSNNGNIVNGDGNSNNANEGDVGNVVPGRPGLRPLIVINSGDRGSSNGVSNGDDNNNGNIVNGNGNSNNANEGNVGNVVPGRPG